MRTPRTVPAPNSSQVLPLLTIPGDGTTNAFTNSTQFPAQRFYRLNVQ